jgi:ankyrin
LLGDYAIQDAELFQLLKWQCLNGVYISFKYLVRSRLKEKQGIFRQRDENGCTLLHYAAQGGSIQILKEILSTGILTVKAKCYRGQTVLHYAIKHKQTNMSEYLINNFTNALVEEFTQSSEDERLETRSPKEFFDPLHWVAWNGNKEFLQILKNFDIDFRRLTRNGLSILDIACLRNESDFCLHILENEEQVGPDKKDSCGWNIAHYAARVNNVDVLKHLNMKRKKLLAARTNDNKTTLHIACEFAHFEAVKYLTEKCTSLLQLKDERDWNALHYATKGGNIKMFEFLMKDKGMKINSFANDGKTVLHIACIHKHVDICEYIADIFSKDHEELLDHTTELKWLPAHYVGVEAKGDGSEEKIMDILLAYGMNLKQRTKDGYSVLEVAIEHLNKTLVKHLISKKCRNAIGISRKLLEKIMEDAKESDIKAILQDALKEMMRDSK